MRALVHIVCLLFSVLALLTPSFAALASDFVTPPTAEQVWTANMTSVEIPAFKPCQKQGGKRVLPCHLDNGLLRGVVALQLYSGKGKFALPIAAQHAGRSGGIDLPPPRHE